MLGIVSDTHGQHARLARALRLLRAAGATRFVHCGDVGGPAVLDEMAPYAATFVWGNTDLHDASLVRYARGLGLTCPDEPPARLTIGGRRCLLYHGHERDFGRLLRLAEDDPRLFASECDAAYVFSGHTHEASDRRLGGVRLINPGALHRARTYTVALLDPATDTLSHWAVPDSEHGDLQPYSAVSK